MGAQTCTDVLPYISLIPVFGYLWPGTSTSKNPAGTMGDPERWGGGCYTVKRFGDPYTGGIAGVGNYAAHHVHIFSCALDKKRYYYHLLHTVARGLFHYSIISFSRSPTLILHTRRNRIKLQSHRTETGTLTITEHHLYPRLHTQPMTGHIFDTLGKF